ncbi:DUF4232 domain-containing protein [Streptomyces lichenis]|uniref:DUF4232 domain-containing protein n=1 Tax=Streptomyces lichenis TaxID=2306967 RepID=A0ABT0IIB7_9ACTN|nr:DUF4232 domain-containing protein [Streptomyces lichenis]MCK8681002.1 DUF4232 domain-containing protein [Streptomyces lichenis]
MSNARTSRNRLLTAAAATAIAALSLTACNDGTGTKDQGMSPVASSTAPGASATAPAAAPSAAKPAPAPAASHQSAGGTSSGKAPAATPTSTVAAGGSGKGGKKDATCDGSNTKTVAAPLSRPVNHMLLTVTNTGSTRCDLYYYPALRFGEAQSVPPVIEDSKPQAVVSLNPGESGYASVNLSAADGSGGKGHTEKSLTVYFMGRTPDQNPTAGATPALPAKGVYIDDSLKTTYWQSSMEDAISW